MKKIIIMTVLVICGSPLFPQYDSVDSLLLDVFGNDKTISNLFGQTPHKAFLYSGIFYDSRTMYAGRELGEDMYTLNGSIYFLHSKGFYIGASGAWYSELDPPYNSTIATTGFRIPFDKKKRLTGRISYSRYFFNVSDTTELVYQNNLGAGLVLRNDRLGCRISFNMPFGQEIGMNLSADLFASITLARVGGRSRIVFSPEVSAFFGSETVEYESSGTLIDPMATTTITSDSYGLLNTQIYLPISFYAGSFDFEAGWSVNFPLTADKTVTYPVSNLFTVSIGFFLPIF